MSDASLATSKEANDNLNPSANHEKGQSNSNSGEESKLSINVAGGTTPDNQDCRAEAFHVSASAIEHERSGV